MLNLQLAIYRGHLCTSCGNEDQSNENYCRLKFYLLKCFKMFLITFEQNFDEKKVLAHSTFELKHYSS